MYKQLNSWKKSQSAPTDLGWSPSHFHGGPWKWAWNQLKNITKGWTHSYLSPALHPKTFTKQMWQPHSILITVQSKVKTVCKQCTEEIIFYSWKLFWLLPSWHLTRKIRLLIFALHLEIHCTSRNSRIVFTFSLIVLVKWICSLHLSKKMAFQTLSSKTSTKNWVSKQNFFVLILTMT